MALLQRLVATLALLSLTVPLSAGEAVYTRNADGRLETVTTDAGTTRYSYFPDGEIAEVVQPDGSRETYDHEELLKARRAANELARELAQEEREQPRVANGFGTSGNRFLFTGYYYDTETGLYYAGARYYDPRIGRFITQDTHLGDLSNPATLNLYVYALANPTRYTDPTGHDAVADAYAAFYGIPQRKVATAVNDYVIRPVDRAGGSLEGTAKTFGRGAWLTLKLAIGMGMDPNAGADVRAADAALGNFAVETVRDPKGMPGRVVARTNQHVNESLDRAQARIAAGDDWGGAAGFTEEVTAPAATTLLTLGEGAVALRRALPRVSALAPVEITSAEASALGISTVRILEEPSAASGVWRVSVDQAEYARALARAGVGAASGRTVDPRRINFSQRTVGPEVEAYARDMAAGNWDWGRSGPLRVMDVDGQLVSYDNRRLMAAQNAGLEGVPVELLKPEALVPGSGRTWLDAFAQRFNDPRNKAAGGPVPPTGLSDQPVVVPPKRTP